MERDAILNVEQVVERAADIAWEAVKVTHESLGWQEAEREVERLRRYLTEVLTALGLPAAGSP